MCFSLFFMKKQVENIDIVAIDVIIYRLKGKQTWKI